MSASFGECPADGDEFTADPAKFTGRQDDPADATGQGQTGTSGPSRAAPTSRR